jgi:hypothetical protein
MKCNRFGVEKLRNEEWFQFYTEFKTLVEQYRPSSLNISPLFSVFVTLYADADEALEIIRKSATTEQLADSDAARDGTLRGFNNAVKSALDHFNAPKREAAKRVQIVIDTYGNIARMYYDEETASIYNFLQEMKGKYADDITLLELTGWVEQLDTDNKAFDVLMKSRYSEEAQKTSLRLLPIRTEIDRNYRDTLDRIDALVLINGSVPPYSAFVKDLNARTLRFENILAQRQGRAAAKKSKSEQKPEDAQ